MAFPQKHGQCRQILQQQKGRGQEGGKEIGRQVGQEVNDRKAP